MIKLAGLVSSSKQKLNEIGDVSKKALAYIEPIYDAAAKKEGFKVTKIYDSSGWPNAQIEVWQVTKQQHSGWVLGECFTKAKATKLAKALKDNMIDYHNYQSPPATTRISKDSYYLSPYEAATIAGVTLDEKKLRELMSQ